MHSAPSNGIAEAAEKLQGRSATGCHTAAHPTLGGCRRRPAAVENGRHAGCPLIEDAGSGNLVMVEWLGPVAARLHERWRKPALGAIDLTLRAPPFA